MLSQRKRNERIFILLFLLPAIIVFLFFYLIPIITVVSSSFTKWNGRGSFEFVFLDNYIKMFSSSSFQDSVKNLFKWTILAGTLHVGYGVVVAFVIHEKPFGFKFTRMAFMIPNVISVAAWAIIFKFVFDNDLGFLNEIIRVFNKDFNVQWIVTPNYAFWAITFTWLFFAAVVSLLVQGDLMAIPKELHESARIDGASKWKTILKIDLPLCRQSIGTAIITSIASRVVMYENIKLITGGGPGTDTMNIPILMVDKIQDYTYGYANAMSVFMIVFGIATMLIINKLFKMNETIY